MHGAGEDLDELQESQNLRTSVGAGLAPEVLLQLVNRVDQAGELLDAVPAA